MKFPPPGHQQPSNPFLPQLHTSHKNRAFNLRFSIHCIQISNFRIMDPWRPIKTESSEPSAAPVEIPAPRPMEGLHEIGPPPFLSKTYEMVDNSATDEGFRKIDPDRWEFANQEFLKGRKNLLKNIRRRRAPSSSHQSLHQGALDPCVEVGLFGVDTEVDRLKRDKQVLMVELVKLRQQQQTTRAYLQAMEERLNIAETKQQHMMSFLARAMQNPSFLQQLSQQREKTKELDEVLIKKRRRQIDQGGIGKSVVKDEPYEVSELEALALEMQGFVKPGSEDPDPNQGDIDEEFWDELLSEGQDHQNQPNT